MADWFKNYNKLYWDNQTVGDSGFMVGNVYAPDKEEGQLFWNVSKLALQKIFFESGLHSDWAEKENSGILNNILGEALIKIDTYQLIKNNLVITATYGGLTYFMVFENYFIKRWGNWDDMQRIKIFFKTKNSKINITKIYKLKFNRLGYCYALLLVGKDVYFVKFNDFVNTKHNLFFFQKSILLTDYINEKTIGGVLDIQENSSKDDLYHIVVQLKDTSFYTAEFDFSQKVVDYDEKGNGLLLLDTPKTIGESVGVLKTFKVDNLESIAISGEILNVDSKKQTVGNIVFGTSSSKVSATETFSYKLGDFKGDYQFEKIDSDFWTGWTRYKLNGNIFRDIYNYYEAILTNPKVSDLVFTEFKIGIFKPESKDIVKEESWPVGLTGSAEFLEILKAKRYHPAIYADQQWNSHYTNKYGLSFLMTHNPLINRNYFWDEFRGYRDRYLFLDSARVNKWPTVPHSYSFYFGGNNESTPLEKFGFFVSIKGTYKETVERGASDFSLFQLSFRPYDKNESGKIFELSKQSSSSFKINKSSNILSNGANKIFVFAKDDYSWNLFKFDNNHNIDLETNRVIPNDNLQPLMRKPIRSSNYYAENVDDYELLEIPYADGIENHFIINSKNTSAMYFLVNPADGSSNYRINLFKNLGRGESDSVYSPEFVRNKLIIKREQNLIKFYNFNIGDNSYLGVSANMGSILRLPFDNKPALHTARPAFWAKSRTGQIGLQRSFDIVRTSSQNFDGTITNKLLQQNLLILSQEIKRGSYNQGSYKEDYWALKDNGSQNAFGEFIKIEKELNQKVFLNWNLEFNWTVNGEIIPAKGENLAKGFYSVNPNGRFNHLEIELIKNDNTKLTKKLLLNENVRKDTSGTGDNENRFRFFLHIDTTKFKRVGNIYLISSYGYKTNDKHQIASVGNFDLKQKDKVAVVAIYYRHFVTNNKAETENKYGTLT